MLDVFCVLAEAFAALQKKGKICFTVRNLSYADVEDFLLNCIQFSSCRPVQLQIPLNSWSTGLHLLLFQMNTVHWMVQAKYEVSNNIRTEMQMQNVSKSFQHSFCETTLSRLLCILCYSICQRAIALIEHKCWIK